MNTDAEEFVTKFVDFWNDPSPQRLPELLHPDVVLTQPLTAPMIGIEAAQAEFHRFPRDPAQAAGPPVHLVAMVALPRP